MISHLPFEKTTPKHWIQYVRQHPIAYQVLQFKTFVNKKIRFIEWNCFLDYDSSYSKQEMIDYVNRQVKKSENSLQIASPTYRIQLDYHAHERWNQRVSSGVSLATLRRKLKQLLRLGRIRLSPKGWGFIDEDILFGYKLEKKRLIFQTFLGRVSLKPALANYAQVLRYIMTQNDRIDLHVSSDVLRLQKTPLIPKESVRFKGTRHSYHLDEYVYTKAPGKLESLFILRTFGDGTSFVTIIDPTNPYGPKVCRSVLYFLLRKGYEDFVLEHIAYYKPEKLGKALTRFTLSDELKEII